MNTFQLQCFLAVSNSLSFARAAEKMNVSQPAITHQIQALENELNTKLFHRSTRMVELTPDGNDFISYARGIVEMEQQAKLRFGNPEGRTFELLSIGAGSHTLFTKLVDILSELLTLHSNLHPKLYIESHERLFHMLDNDSAHIIFDFKEIAPSREHMVFVPLCGSNIFCVCRYDVYNGQDCILSIRQLAQHSVIINDPVFLSSEALNLHTDLTENLSRSNIHFSDSVAGAITLARAGYGFAIIPEVYTSCCTDLNRYRLEQAPDLTFGMFYNEMNCGDTLESFIKLTRKAFSQSRYCTERTPTTEPMLIS